MFQQPWSRVTFPPCFKFMLWKSRWKYDLLAGHLDQWEGQLGLAIVGHGLIYALLIAEMSINSRQSEGSSDPSEQSDSVSHIHSSGMHFSLLSHLNWFEPHLARQLMSSPASSKLSGQAQVYVWPPGAIKHRWEQPPLSSPQGFTRPRIKNK